MNMVSRYGIVLVLVAPLYSAPTHQELFLQANAAYNAHDYDAALELYTKIPHKGPVVWYNMGNCAFQLKRYPYAYLYWKKSQQDGSWRLIQDAEHNIQILKHGSCPESISLSARVTGVMDGWVHWSSLWWLQISLLLIWCLFWWLYVYGVPHFLQGLVLLLVCCCGIALKGKYTDATLQHGIIVRPQAAIYAAPDTTFCCIAQLDEMAEVIIESENRNWYKISYKNQVGWIPADSIVVG